MLVNAFQSGCVHNYEPMINSILAEPNPAPTNSIVSLTCKASDDDESSMLKKRFWTMSGHAPMEKLYRLIKIITQLG